MRICRKWFTILLTLLLMVQCSAYALTPEDYDVKLPQTLEQDHLYAESAVMMDGVSGKVLFTKNPRQRMYPASTTKIMTVMLALESGISLDTPVVVPQQAAKIPKDSTLVPVFPGDQLPFGDLLYGCMLASGNDAANAVAVLVAGSIDAFVDRMNRRASELGCSGTHFENPHGYHNSEHYTTAMDMARIAQAALNIDEFRKIASTQRHTFTIRRDGQEITPTRANSNVLLNEESRYYYEDCIGVKTGTHSMAGNCFVGAVERDGVRLITVALKCAESNQKWVDTVRMFNYGYTRYSAVSLDQLFSAASDKIGKLKVSNAIASDPEDGGLSMKIAQVSDPEYIRMIPIDSDTAMDEAVADFVSRSTMTITHKMVAPVSEGEIMGQLRYVAQNGEVITALLIAGRSVQEQPPRFSLTDYFPFLKRLNDPLVRALLIVLAALIALLIIAAIARGASRRRRRDKIYKVRRHEELESERAENRRRRERARMQREARKAKRRKQWERSLDVDDEEDDDFDDYDDFEEFDDFDDD